MLMAFIVVLTKKNVKCETWKSIFHFQVTFRSILIVQCVYDTSGSLTCIINQLQYNFIKEKALQLTPEQQWSLGVGVPTCVVKNLRVTFDHPETC